MTAARFWEENRNVLTVLGVAVLAAIAARVVIVGPVRAAEQRDRNAYSTLQERLKKAREGAFDLAYATQSLTKSSASIEKEMEKLKEQVKFPFTKTDLPKDDPGAVFVRRHAEIVDQLKKKCGTARPKVLLLDEALGFQEILDEPLAHDEAEVNLSRLDVVDQLVRLLVDSGVKEIVKISHEKPIMTGPEGFDVFIKEYPVQITVRTRLDPLMRFCHQVRRPGSFFLVVREMNIRGRDPYLDGPAAPDRGDDSVLTAVVSAAGMLFPDPDEIERDPDAPTAPTERPTGPRLVPPGVPFGA